MQLRLTAFAAVALTLLAGATALAQPQQQHLVQAGNLAYRGKFYLPPTDGTGRGTAEGSLLSGGSAIGLGPDGQSLYYGCHDWGSRLARVTIPAIGGTGSIVEPCAPIANLGGINPADPNFKKLGGSLWWNGRLTVSAYSYYDGNGTAIASHFVGGDVATQNGPYRVGPLNPGLVGGYMGVIPQEWRGLLGGPALTGQCCLAIIARSSFGPAVSVFDPDDLGKSAQTPSNMLVGYPQGHQTFGPWNVPNPYFTGVTHVGGVAFPAGTRSVLFIGRHGTTFCYGTGTGNPALAGQPDGLGNVYCYDPIDGSKGSHGYPYKHQIWAYDALDLLAVKQGSKNPWDVLPYAIWNLSEMDASQSSATMRSAVYDPATRRWFVVTDNADKTPEVHVYEVTSAVLQPPVPGPVGFGAQVTSAGVSLLWFPPLAQGLAGYRLDVGSAPGAADVGSLAMGATARSLPLPRGVSGVFYFRLVALYADGTSGASPELRVPLGGGGGGAVRPAAPTNVRAAMNGADLVLSWDPPSDGSVTTVVADVGTSSGATNLAVGAPLGKYGPYVVRNAPAGTYYLRLRAVSAASASVPSNEAFVTVGGGSGGAPPPPTGLRATVNAARMATLVWSVNENGPDTGGYIVEAGSRSGLSDYGSVRVQTQGTSAGPVPPGVYYLRVRAFNNRGTSAPGAEVRLVVP